MHRDEWMLDVAVGLAADVAASKVTEYAQTALYRLTSSDVKKQEERVRPGPPYDIAAQNTAGLLDIQLDHKQLSRAGIAFHYIAGAAWGAVYCLMRRAAGMNSVRAGTATGASTPLILDEAITPALGSSAPNRAYPIQTHVRGFLGHIVYGLALAASAEVLYRALARASGGVRHG